MSKPKPKPAKPPGRQGTRHAANPPAQPTTPKRSSSRKQQPNVRAVDLFCGIGGLTYGLAEAGVKVEAGIDNDPSCQAIYTQNNQGAEFLHADIRNLAPEQIAEHYQGADLRVLAGCAPCQPFSSHTRKHKNSSANDDCSLLSEFSRIMQAIQPEIITIENVPGLAKHPVFGDFQNTLDAMGYHHTTKTVQCQQYGIPQTRKRLVLLASTLGPIDLIDPTHPNKDEWPTVKKVIGKMKPLKHGETSPTDPSHVSLKLSDLNLQRIRQSTPGGSWRDWDAELIAPCHKAAHYPAPYGRMRWDTTAPTITTQFCYYSTGRFGHPRDDRAISIREGGLLQTFPIDYEFQNEQKPLLPKIMAQHIGNAVPVKLGKAIGDSIRRHIDER